MKSLILGFLLALICLPPLHAQTTNAPADSNATATPAPTAQAPDDVTNKIIELVHAGQYAEAQRLTTGLLVAYPDDQRLIKAKALLEKLLAPASPATATPGGNQPTNNVAPAQPAANTNAVQLTGMDKVDYNALIQRAREAQQTTDLAQQRTLLKQFMDDSSQFLQKHPDQMLIWQLRAASAISLNEPMAGYEAGQKLLAAGAADSNEPNLQGLLGQLKNKGWLEAEDPFASVRSKLKAADGPSRGAQNPTILMVEFIDFQCPYCKAAQPMLEKLLADYSQVRLVFQQFPLPASLHPWAMKAAEYTDCAAHANPESFWKYGGSIFESQGDITLPTADNKLQKLAKAAGLDAQKLAACVIAPETEARVKNSLQLGHSLDVTGTPTVFINGRRVVGIATYEELNALVRSEIGHAGR